MVKTVLEEVPTASVLLQCADELVFRLPRDSVQKFPGMLRRLEVRLYILTLALTLLLALVNPCNEVLLNIYSRVSIQCAVVALLQPDVPTGLSLIHI